MQYLFRLLFPSPHVTEQVLHASQGFQVTVSKSEKKMFWNVSIQFISKQFRNYINPEFLNQSDSDFDEKKQ